MSQNASDILRLPAMACSAEQQVSGAPSSVCSSHSNLTSSPADSGAKLDKSEQPGLAVACTRRARNFWSVHEDTVLVATIIDNTAFLRGPANTRPRSRFWLHISFELKVRHGLSRNKRQCRDRFNLIYWKAVRDSHQDLSADSKLAGLMRECMRRFYIDKDNNLMLRPQAPSPATPVTHTGAPAGANAVAAAMPASPVPKPQLELLAQLQSQVLQLTHRMDDLHRALDAHRALVHQLEQSPDAWPHADEPSVGVAAHGYQERCAGRIFGLNDQIW